MKLFHSIMALMCLAFYPAWAGPDDDVNEILNVESLEGRSGFFRGFVWRKEEGDIFHITPVRSGPRQCLANQEEIEAYFRGLELWENARREIRELEGGGAAILRENGQYTLANEEELEEIRQNSERKWRPYERIMQSPETAVMTLLPRAGNLRINYRDGTVILDNMRLAGDLIVSARRFGERGLIHCHNFVALSCEEIPGLSISGGMAGSWKRSERGMASSRNFHPYNGHHLIAGR